MSLPVSTDLISGLLLDVSPTGLNPSDIMKNNSSSHKGHTHTDMMFTHPFDLTNSSSLSLSLTLYVQRMMKRRI